jgi:formylglycine-generating enzyme required for sulfatase activity
LLRGLEREKAARGDKDDRAYPWSDVWEPERANHDRLSAARFPETSPVTAFTRGAADGRSPFGVADITGNVSEWVSEGAAIPAGRGAKMRAIRGGGWSDSCALNGLVTMKVGADIDYHSPSTGFRCAMDIVYDEQPVPEQ